MALTVCSLNLCSGLASVFPRRVIQRDMSRLPSLARLMEFPPQRDAQALPWPRLLYASRATLCAKVSVLESRRSVVASLTSSASIALRAKSASIALHEVLALSPPNSTSDTGAVSAAESLIVALTLTICGVRLLRELPPAEHHDYGTRLHQMALAVEQHRTPIARAQAAHDREWEDLGVYLVALLQDRDIGDSILPLLRELIAQLVRYFGPAAVLPLQGPWVEYDQARAAQAAQTVRSI